MSKKETYNSQNKIILDDFVEIHNIIKSIIDMKDLDEKTKIDQIILNVNSIKFPKYYNYYSGDDFYKDKYKYLLS